MRGLEKRVLKFRSIARFLKGSGHFLLLALLAGMLNTAFNALTPQIIRYTVDHLTGQEQSSVFPAAGGQFLLLAAAAVMVSATLAGLFTYCSNIWMAKGSEGFLKTMRDQLYRHIQRLPYTWHVRHKTGDIIQRCTNDVEIIRSFICNQLMEVIRIVFLIVLYLSIMFSMNVRLSCIVLLFLPVIIGYSAFFYSRISRRFLQADEAEGELTAKVQENLTGVRVVRAFGRESYEIERFDEKNNLFASLWIKVGRLMSVYWGAGDFLTGIQMMTVLVTGTVFTVQGSLTLGELMAFISYNASLAWPIRSLGRVLSNMSKAGVSIDRVTYILDAREETGKAEDVRPPLDKDICFSHVNFHYEADAPVLKDVSFRIPAGSTFAVLGSTGSGKSTLVHLLDRLYELPEGCGSITIGGVDIRQIDREHLRRNIGMVLQEPFLFSRSVGENIAITLEEEKASSAERAGSATPSREIRDAAAIACVDEAIEQFKDGYDTMVGERGVTLSGGQKQRVAIARMLVQHAPIMVFDDSLSAVDAETDVRIRRALKERMGKSTVILISHRITTLMQADCILVLENGAVAEMGTHEELCRQNGIYRRIYDIQMNLDDAFLEEETGTRKQTPDAAGEGKGRSEATGAKAVSPSAGRQPQKGGE